MTEFQWFAGGEHAISFCSLPGRTVPFGPNLVPILERESSCFVPSYAFAMPRTRALYGGNSATSLAVELELHKPVADRILLNPCTGSWTAPEVGVGPLQVIPNTRPIEVVEDLFPRGLGGGLGEPSFGCTRRRRGQEQRNGNNERV